MMLNCAIIDDEFLARQYIREYVSKIPSLNLVGDYDSPLLILDELKNHRIDILFLDIRMPDISGLDFLKVINPQPIVILTTAYKEYAVEGYEYNVIDYLLKPFSFERFMKAVNKAADILQRERMIPEENPEKDSMPEPIIESDHIIIRADRKWYKINYEDLWIIEGQKAYVTLHTKNKKITALISLKELENLLPPDKFLRIHKSFIVSIKHIETLEGNRIGICGQQLSVGSNYREKVYQLFDIRPDKL
jgi:DNA-binding LytR/AlgR family response regulator